MNPNRLYDRLYEVCDFELQARREGFAQESIAELTVKWPEIEAKLVAAKDLNVKSNLLYRQYSETKTEYSDTLRAINSDMYNILGRNVYVEDYSLGWFTFEQAKKLVTQRLNSPQVREFEGQMHALKRSLSAAAALMKTDLMLSKYLQVMFEMNGLNNEGAKKLIDELQNN